jgi:hypothetical protein
MKINLLLIIISFISFHFALSGQTNSKKASQFIPLKVGNYWVYATSGNQKPDTIKISKKKIIGTDTAYYYNGNFWMEKNDTVYEFQSQRNGYEFPTEQYFPSDKKIEYGILIGGDAYSPRTVEKIKGTYKVNGKEYPNCYEFSEKIDGGYAITIISKGIGIIEIKTPDRVVSLLEYKID